MTESQYIFTTEQLNITKMKNLPTVPSTFAIRTRQPHKPKIAKELETLQPEKNYFFKSPLLKIIKTLTHNPSQKRTLTMTAKLNADNGCKTRPTRTPACNSGFKKLAVQWFVGQFCGYINISASYEVCAENRHLRQAANRYE